jgi:hypothetical protein
MLINLSNHPISMWSEAQKKAAYDQYGQVVDLLFPAVDPAGDEEYVKALVTEYLSKIQSIIRDFSNVTVHIMGEMNFTFAMITELQKLGIKCVASTTTRVTLEDNGVKSSEFRFVKFREYEKLQ